MTAIQDAFTKLPSRYARYHYRHKADLAYQIRHRNTDRRRRFIGFYNAVEYLGGRCTDCGYLTNLNALQFDHVVEQRKQGRTIHSYFRMAWTTLKAALDKCELVCANCHAIRTAQRGQLTTNWIGGNR